MSSLSILKQNHFLLWEIMQSAESKYRKILADFDSKYVALSHMDETSEKFNAAIDKLVEEENQSGKHEAHDAFVSAYNAMLDNASEFLKLEYPKQWKEISSLLNDPSNRIIYRDRILKIFANLGK